MRIIPELFFFAFFFFFFIEKKIALTLTLDFFHAYHLPLIPFLGSLQDGRASSVPRLGHKSPPTCQLPVQIDHLALALLMKGERDRKDILRKRIITKTCRQNWGSFPSTRLWSVQNLCHKRDTLCVFVCFWVLYRLQTIGPIDEVLLWDGARALECLSLVSCLSAPPRGQIP